MSTASSTVVDNRQKQGRAQQILKLRSLAFIVCKQQLLLLQALTWAVAVWMVALPWLPCVAPEKLLSSL